MSEKKRQLSEEEFRDKLKNGEYDKFKKVEVDDEFGEYIQNLIKISIKDEIKNALESKYDEDNFILAEEMERKNYEMSSAQNVMFPELLVNDEIDLTKKFTVQNNLIKYIKNSGFTQAEIAEKIGINKGTLSNIINGKYSTSLDIALKLALLFGVPVELLFWLDENTK